MSRPAKVTVQGNEFEFDLGRVPAVLMPRVLAQDWEAIVEALQHMVEPASRVTFAALLPAVTTDEVGAILTVLAEANA